MKEPLIDKQKLETFLQVAAHRAAFGSVAPLLQQASAIVPAARLAHLQKAAIIACADHGISQLGISAYPPETTIQMTRNYLLSRGAVANAMSKFAGAELFVVDMGISGDVSELYAQGLLNKKIALGTQDFTQGAAMTHAQAQAALKVGEAMAADLAQQGCDCFLLGEMGIGNTSSSAAIAACMCGLTPQAATGRGTNISDARLKVKIGVVERGLQVNQPNRHDGVDVLMKVGGFEFGCLAGVILGAAKAQKLVILDGFNTAAAALIAQAIEPSCVKCLLPSHLAGEPAHRAALSKLGLQPYLDLQLKLSETAGSSLIARLLEMGVQAIEAYSSRPSKLPLPRTYQFDESVRQRAQERVDNLTKPLHSLGCLETIAVDLCGILGTTTVDMALVEARKSDLADFVIACSRFFVQQPQERAIAYQCGLVFVRAALAMFNEMKTFAEAAVAVANDGPGAVRQKAIKP